MNAFTTIITPDFIHYALTLRESLIQFNENLNFFILLTEKDIELKKKTEEKYPGTVILFCDVLCQEGIGRKIYEKYFLNQKDEFRWSMKPVLLKYLFEKLNVTKALYLDSDLFFFNSYDFLFEELEKSRVILTPHWRSSDPHSDPANFKNLLNDGLYNAGFLGANNDSIEIMDWWAMVCEYACMKQPEKGYFVDQAYLNVIPVEFDNVEIIKHKGCNVANWNQVECKRLMKENGVLINGEYPIVFIHFTASTIRGIINGTDKFLTTYLEEYSDVIKKYSPKTDITEKYKIRIPELASKPSRKERSGWFKWFK